MQKIVNGIQTTYADVGEQGSPFVVILHGWGCNHAVYKRMTAEISANYRVVVPDLPGFGGTVEPPEPWSMDVYADWVCAFIQAFSPRRVILLGHSFGGHLAIKIAARSDLPFEIDKVVLVGSAGIVRKPSLRSRLNSRMYKIGRGVMSTPPMKKIFPNVLQSMWNKRASADYKAASPLMRKIMVNRLTEDLTHVMPDITAPTLLIWGENDTATPLDSAKEMERLIPGSGLAVIQNAGHFCFVDQPVIFGKIIASFLRLGG